MRRAVARRHDSPPSLKLGRSAATEYDHSPSMRTLALAVALAMTGALSSTLVAVVGRSISHALAASLAAFVVAFAWCSVVSRGPRAGIVVTAASVAVDLTLAAVVPYGAPWLSLGYVLPRVGAMAVGARLARGVSLTATRRRALTFALVALASPGALFVGEIIECLARAKGDPPRHVETAVVLGFGLLEGGRVSPVFRARIAEGVALHRRGLARRVLFTGGVGTYGPAEGVAAMEVARSMGLAPEATLFEARSRTTRENMACAAEVMREHGLSLRSVAVVSDTFHLARARRYARDAGLDASTVAAITPAWTAPRRALWWVIRESALLVGDDLHRVAPWLRRPAQCPPR